MPTLKKNFFGLQFAVGVNGGVECCIHAFRTVLMDNPNLAGLLIDFENMFNEISREGVLLAVHRQCLDAYPFIYSFYSKGAKIRFQSGDSSYENLFSTQGVFQGDVWGSIASCCLLLDFQSKLNERLLDKNFQTLQLAIADDLTIIGHPNSIIAAWEFISEYAPSKSSGIIAPEPFALKIKVSKCKVFSFAPLSLMKSWFPVFKIPNSVERISGSEPGCGIKFLGAPIGHEDFCISFCNDLVTHEYAKKLKAIAIMKDVQSALLLLRFCHVTCFSFILRTTEPKLVKEAAVLMDLSTSCHLVFFSILKDFRPRICFSW
jgi:hypothetical protein